MSQRHQFSAALFAVLLLTTSLSAQPPKSNIDDILNMLSAVRTFSGAAISPDGKRVAWVESVPGQQGAPDLGTSIYVKDLTAANARPQRITAGNGTTAYDEHAIAWSPDSNRP